MRGLVLRNASWLTFGYGAEIVIRFCSSLILTRLLDPGAYGLISTIMVFMTVAFMLSELGIRQIVLTDPRGDDADFLQTVWTVEILRGVALTTGLALIAIVWHYLQVSGVIADNSPYRNPLLPPLLGLICLSLAAMGFASTNMFRLARHMEQGAMTKIEIASKLLTSILSVLFTIWFRNVWGIALAMTLGAIIRTWWTIRYLPGPPMRLRFHRADIIGVLTKSRWIALGSGLTVLTSSGDKVLLGYGFGLEILGVYAVAVNMIDALNGLVGRIQSTMGISFLFMMKDKPLAEQHNAYYRFRLPIDLYCAAAGLGLVILGPWFFQTMYDHRYHDAGRYAAFLGVSLLLLPLTYSENFALRGQHFKYLSFTMIARLIVFFGIMAIALSIHSVTLAVIAVAIQRLPEFLLYVAMPRGGTPFRWSRDGLLIGLAAASIAFRLTF